MRMAGFRARSRLAVAVSAAIACLIVGACGSSDAVITVASTGNGVGVWGVITTDTVAMAVIKNAEGTSSNVTVVDGDQHMGSHVCGFSVSKNGHNYQLDWYTDNSVAAAALQSSECGSDAQQQFLSEAP